MDIKFKSQEIRINNKNSHSTAGERKAYMTCQDTVSKPNAMEFSFFTQIYKCRHKHNHES